LNLFYLCIERVLRSLRFYGWLENMEKAERKVLIKYDPRGVGPSFWQKLYGYSKGKYRYAGLLDDLPGAGRVAKTLIAVPEGDVKKVKSFLRKQGAGFEEQGTVAPATEAPGFLRWGMPREVLQDRLEGLGEEMDRLGPFIKTDSRRDALKDVERHGY